MRTRHPAQILPAVAAALAFTAGCDWFIVENSDSLGFDTSSVALQAVEGDTVPVERLVTLSLDGTGTVSWAATSDQSWLTITPSSGSIGAMTTMTLRLSADPTGLAAGLHEATVTAIDTAGGARSTVLVVALDVTPLGPTNTFGLSPVQLDFQAVEGDTASLQDTTTLSFDGAGTVTWTSASDQTWLTATPPSGTVDEASPETITVTVDPTDLAVGLHTGYVTASDAAFVVPDAVLTVTLYVARYEPASALHVSPVPARLYALEGDMVFVEATVTLSLEGGTGVGWAATPADAWLTTDIASGTLSDAGEVQVKLRVDPSGKTVGLIVTSLTFSTPGGEAADVVVAVSFALRSQTPGNSGLAYYLSEIDDTLQPYGIRLPSPFTPGAGSPVALKMHGYGGHASSPSAVTQADSMGMILVNLEGRGQHFYDGAAEKDLFEVLADIDGAYTVDWTRVFLEGSSMGGTGAFRHIARHAGVFAGAAGCDGWTDFNQWHRHWYAPAAPADTEVHPARVSNLEYASPLTHAENVLPDRLYVATDGNDTSVWPENGVKLDERLTRLGTTHTNVFNPTGGHGSSYNTSAFYDFFAARAPLELDPADVRIRSNRLRTAKHAWMKVERFAWDGWADLTAVRTVNAGTCTYALVTRNVARFAITAPPGGETVSRYVVVVDGATCVDQPAGAISFPLTVELTVDASGAVTGGDLYQVPATPALEKAPGLEGPVMRALTERFVVAWGSAHADPLVNAANREEARKFCDHWADIWNDGTYGFNTISTGAALTGTLSFTNGSTTVAGTGTAFAAEIAADDLVKLGSSSTWYRVASVTSDTELELTAAFFQTTASGAASVAATVTPVDEKDLSRTDLASAHLVIFGSEESSSLITEMAVSPTAPFNLPARVLEDQITLAGEVFLVPEHGVWMTYPNPLAPGRLVVLGHNVIGDTAGLTDMVFWVHEAWPWFWPDYVVFDTSQIPRSEVSAGEDYTADQYVRAGFFDRDWALAGPSDARTAALVATDAATYGVGTATATVTVTVEDEMTALVPALASSAFEVRIDGELRPATFIESATPGIYDADVTISDLIVAGYDLTVEVVRPDAGGPVVGVGRARFGVQ